MSERHYIRSTYDVGVQGFTHALRVPLRGDLLFVSGVTARRRDGEIVGVGDIVAQTRQVYGNLGSILEEAGGGFGDVVRMVTYLTNMHDLPQVHVVRAEYFDEFLPTSTSVQVVALADDRLLIEVEVTAVISEPGVG